MSTALVSIGLGGRLRQLEQRQVLITYNYNYLDDLVDSSEESDLSLQNTKVTLVINSTWSHPYLTVMTSS
jgi:hypothetical protein